MIFCPECKIVRCLVDIITDDVEYCDEGNTVVLKVEIPRYSCPHCGIQFLAEIAEELRQEAVGQYKLTNLREFLRETYRTS